MDNRRVVRVLPDVAAIDKEFDYLVPDALAARVGIGTVVRIDLHGRRVGGWVVADDVEPPGGVAVRRLAKVTGWGPPAELIDLAGWASRRWVGPRAAFLKTASPDRAVRGLPPPHRGRVPVSVVAVDDLAGEAIAAARPGQPAVLRLPPAADPITPVLAAAQLGPALVVVPSVLSAIRLAERLERRGLVVAVMPHDWAQAAAGAQVVIGARAAVWAPCAGMASVVVLDGHDESLQQEQAPTWNAWMVAVERARRAAAHCIVVSACPTVELLVWSGGAVVAPSRAAERAGWAPLEVVDRRRDDPHTGLYSHRLVGLLREGGRLLCVLNRKGRARLSACSRCRELVRCERCGAAVGLAGGEPATLVCRRCGVSRPPVCSVCGSTRLKSLRVGISRVRDDLEALAGRAVGEVSAETAGLPETSILVGTEAVLHRLSSVDGVAFLDFDQELLAGRYRAAEEALVLLARASRLVGGRNRSGRVLVQTRLPQHEVLMAAVAADPSRLSGPEAAMRSALGLPPARAVALVSGEAAPAYVEGLVAAGVDVVGPDRGKWLIRAADHDALSAALIRPARSAGRLRIEVDPLRI